ncbi:ribosomal L7Ae/L30e/S12e/Gadd45 family protein [Paenibacillus marinisediminis]
MSNEKSLQDLKVKIGTRQTIKLVESNQAVEVYIALDAEEKLVSKITTLCHKHGVRLTEVKTMLDLGKACGIDVGAAMAAVIIEEQ